MKAAVKGKYDYDAAKGLSPSAVSTLAIPAGDIKLRTSFTDATVTSGSSLPGLVLGVEKPGFFIVDYNVPKKDFRFQFMSSIRVLEKRLNMTYIHNKNDNRTMVDGTLVLDPANKVSLNHTLGSKNGMFKYTYTHGGGVSFEPRYDLANNTWDFAVSRKLFADDVVRASYHTSTKVLGLEWARNSKTRACFKVGASVNLTEEDKKPKLFAESTWNVEM
ncbi:hypothetical protein V2J09_023800 [Rumex salicifolius]